MSKPLENKIEKELIKQIAAQGGAALKLKLADGGGFPDRSIFLPGNYFAVAECKRLGKELDPLQTRFKKELFEPLGFRFYSVRTKADIQKIISDYHAYLEGSPGTKKHK
jgi:predicted xylose isomerase-like sugar epimerase